MRFQRITSNGATQYQAECETYRYVAERYGKEWSLAIRKLETVAGIRVTVAGRPFYEATHDTLTTCKAVSAEFVMLGDGYRSSDHGYRERTTEATLRAYGHIVTSESATITDTTNGEAPTMADKSPTAAERHAATREEVTANIERVRSLAEAENTEGAKELSEVTDKLIASLPAKERMKLRAELTEAGQAKPQVPATTGTVATLATEDYTAVEGAVELRDLGAAKVTESVNLHIKGTHTAKEVAAVVLDIRRRMTNKDGHPDLTGRSNAAKTIASDMYKAAGAAITGDDFDVETSVKKMVRSVQNQMSDVMAAYLRGLDESPEEAAHFAKIMEGQPEGTKVSEAVAAHYGLKLKGATEIAREKYEAAKELEAGSEGAEADTEDGEGSEAEEETPDEKVAATVKKIVRDLRAAKPEDFENASEEAKKAARTSLEEANKALKAMIAATL